jgi:hypothetical protein
MAIDSGMARDASIIGANVTGASQNALPLNGSRQFLHITNVGNASIGVNYSGAGAGGGTAAIGGTGTETLAPNEKLTFDKWVPQNSINIIGVAGQPITIIEG